MFIDADAMLLPDAITLPLLWIGLPVVARGRLRAAPRRGVGRGCRLPQPVGRVLDYKLATGKEGFGYGDFKLLAALGAWFGWKALLPIILMSAGVGAVVGIALIVTGRRELATQFAYGVYLAPAGLLMLFAGQRVIEAILPTIA